MKPFVSFGWQPQVMAVLGRQKAIFAGKLEVYDVVADPMEARDLGADADERPSRAERLTEQLEDRRPLLERLERLIETSGVEWTFLRAGIFAGNARHFWGPQIRAGGVVRWCTTEMTERACRERCATELCDDWFWKDRLPCWNWGYGG